MPKKRNSRHRRPKSNQHSSLVKRYLPISLTALGIILTLSALLLALITYTIIIGVTNIELDKEVLDLLIILNVISITIILSLIIFQIIKLLRSRKSKNAGSNLHSRLVLYFSMIVAFPAILIAVFASITLNQGLDRYFADRTQKVINNSIAVAKLYYDSLSADTWSGAEALTQEVNRIYPIYKNSIKNPKTKKYFEDILQIQVLFKQLDGALILDANAGAKGEVLVVYDRNPKHVFPFPSKSALKRAKDEGIIRLDATGKTLVLVYLESFDQYLYVYKNIDPVVTRQLINANSSVIDFYNLEKQRVDVQIVFALIYISISLTLILSAIWFAFQFANQLIAPVRRLVNAAQKVSHGDFNVDLPVHKSEGDLADLSLTFNNMTQRLTDQRHELVTANDAIDARRRFNEAMLSGVSAGIIGLDKDQIVTLVNEPAARILKMDAEEIVGKKMKKVAPKLNRAIQDAYVKGQRVTSGQMIENDDLHEQVLNFRMTEEKSSGRRKGYVITLDDISDLVSAQRTSAWADIAQRIAHEIKNPLTPIQLSAERLKRKYKKIIPEDDKVFDQCVDTIVRQVGDIGNMVDEFSSFAKMPSAKLEKDDLIASIKEAIFLQKVANPDIKFANHFPSGKVTLRLDRRLITQVITNVIKNASESIETAIMNHQLDAEDKNGKIEVKITEHKQNVTLDVMDNGIGLPQTGRQKLLEPYMTTRSKGTGLGLAIVKRIMEEHGGTVELMDAPKLSKEQDHLGAMVRLTFPNELKPIEN